MPARVTITMRATTHRLRQVLATVLALKLAMPRWVHLNRGNHEDEGLAYAYDFAAGGAHYGNRLA